MYQSMPQDSYALDDALSAYIQTCWEEGEGRALIADTVAGMKYFRPHLKRALPLEDRLSKASRRNEIPARAPPFTP